MARKYELKSRAARQEVTRQRIVAATVELHEEVGPARTSISAIAERAGVERLTVYRHFATEHEIYQACSARFNELHPFPDFQKWEAIDDPIARFELGLTELYRYFADTERMMAAILRDAPSTPAMHEPFARYQQGFRAIVELLIAPFPSTGTGAANARLAILLAVSFDTWRIMVLEAGLSRAEAVAFQVRLVRC